LTAITGGWWHVLGSKLGARQTAGQRSCSEATGERAHGREKPSLLHFRGGARMTEVEAGAVPPPTPPTLLQRLVATGLGIAVFLILLLLLGGVVVALLGFDTLPAAIAQGISCYLSTLAGYRLARAACYRFFARTFAVVVAAALAFYAVGFLADSQTPVAGGLACCAIWGGALAVAAQVRLQRRAASPPRLAQPAANENTIDPPAPVTMPADVAQLRPGRESS
jgi:hypothetical protein